MKKTILFCIILGFFYTLNAREVKTNPEPLKPAVSQTVVKFEFKPLPFAYDALEPYIDKQTVELHYTKHHKSAYDTFIAAIKGTPMEKMDIMEIFKNVSKLPVVVRNNGGSYYNHMLYWENMKAKGGGTPSGKLSDAINKTFGSFEEFKKLYADAGKSRYGSGYAWLAVDEKGELFVCSMPNQDNPLMDLAERKGTPLLVMDVWEHSYYLKYQNRRADYIDAFWNVVNWDEVARRYDNALKTGKN
jgi:superoxide dismutase, Fe-Mn family